MQNHNYKKNILSRVLSSILLLIPLVISTLLLILIVPKNEETDYIVNVLSLAILIFFTILEIFILLKNLKKDPIILSLMYNSNDTINTGALVITNVILLIALSISVASGIIYFNSTDINIQNACIILFPMAIYTLINCLLYNLYLLIYRYKKFSLEDLA